MFEADSIGKVKTAGKNLLENIDKILMDEQSKRKKETKVAQRVNLNTNINKFALNRLKQMEQENTRYILV